MNRWRKRGVTDEGIRDEGMEEKDRREANGAGY